MIFPTPSSADSCLLTNRDSGPDTYGWCWHGQQQNRLDPGRALPLSMEGQSARKEKHRDGIRQASALRIRTVPPALSDLLQLFRSETGSDLWLWHWPGIGELGSGLTYDHSHTSLQPCSSCVRFCPLLQGRCECTFINGFQPQVASR